MDHHFDGLELDTVHYPHDKARDFMHRIDEAVVDNASTYIKDSSPDLSWVYLEYTDDMGHAHGDSPEFYKAVEMMDRQMGRLWEAIQLRRQKFKEDWTIFITTDHGRTASTGKGHGGQSDRERNTWIVTNARGLNDYFTTGNPGIVDIMASIAGILKINIPKHQLMEVDGIRLTGTLSAINPHATFDNGKLNITWKATAAGKGKAKIWVTTTNHFKEGGKDDYTLVATVPVARQTAVIDVVDKSSSFYKIVIETPNNFLNTWINK